MVDNKRLIENLRRCGISENYIEKSIFLVTIFNAQKWRIVPMDNQERG